MSCLMLPFSYLVKFFSAFFKSLELNFFRIALYLACCYCHSFWEVYIKFLPVSVPGFVYTWIQFLITPPAVPCNYFHQGRVYIYKYILPLFFVSSSSSPSSCYFNSFKAKFALVLLFC